MRWRSAILIVGLVLAVSSCSPAPVTRQHPAPTPDQAAPRITDSGLPAACEDKDLTCTVSPHGQLLVRIDRARARARRPVLLWEPGGPGLDVLSHPLLLPKWTARFRVVLVPEPWTYHTAAFCAAHECHGRQLSAERYQGAVRYAERRWGRIDAIWAFSFGAVRIGPLLESQEFAGRPVSIAAPAPLAGTPGSAIARERRQASWAAIAETICAPDGGRSCVSHATRSVRRFARGGPDLPPRTATLGLLSLAGRARANSDFLRTIIEVGPGELTDNQALAVRRAEFALSLGGGTGPQRDERQAYLKAVCATYPGWTGRDPFSAMHRSCLDPGHRPRPDGPALPSISKRSGEIFLQLNSADPVAPYLMQRRWSSYLGDVRVSRYTALEHSPPASPPPRFLRLAGLG